MGRRRVPGPSATLHRSDPRCISESPCPCWIFPHLDGTQAVTATFLLGPGIRPTQPGVPGPSSLGSRYQPSEAQSVWAARAQASCSSHPRDHTLGDLNHRNVSSHGSGGWRFHPVSAGLCSVQRLRGRLLPVSQLLGAPGVACGYLTLVSASVTMWPLLFSEHPDKSRMAS